MIGNLQTGAELAAALRRVAAQRRVPVTSLTGQLSPHPDKWLQQLSAAKRPRPATVARVEALLAGESVPPAPPNNFQLPARAADPTPTLDQLSRAALLMIDDRPLPAPEAAALLSLIDSWCATTNTLSSAFGLMACDFGGFVGLLRKRGSVRTRTAALAHAFMTRWPGGVPHDRYDAERLRVRDMLSSIRLPDRRRQTHPVPTLSATPAPQFDRDPCWRCGARGDAGCGCRRGV